MTGQICGTSFAAPAVASLAANVVSKYPALLGVPEALRTVIMASSTPLPGKPRWTTGEDLDAGAGTPTPSVLDAIAANPKSGSIFSSSSAYGYTRNLFAPVAGNGTEQTYTITLTSSTAQYLQWWVGWTGDPSNHAPDALYPADDLDIAVSRPGATAASSLTAPSTERVAIYKPSGTVTFTVKVKLYQRNSNPNSNIQYALAWRATGSTP
jgi:hypothetical protein